MSTTIQSRMGEFLQTIGLTAEQFEKQVGLGCGFVSRLSNNIRKSSMLKIVSCYPNLNTRWFLTGDGEMFSCDSKLSRNLLTPKDRLHAYAEYLHLSDSAFCRKADLSPSYITKLNGNMRSSSVSRIKNAFPLLNMQWLETGEGNMLLEHHTPVVDMSIVARINKIISFLGISRAIFEKETGLSRGYVSYADNVSLATASKICKRYPFISRNWLMWGIGEMIARSCYSVPLVNASDESQVASVSEGRWSDIAECVNVTDADVDFAITNLASDRFPIGSMFLCKRVSDDTDGLLLTITQDAVNISSGIKPSNFSSTYRVIEAIIKL